MTERLRVLLAPDSIYWVTGTIAKSIAAANPWIDATIVSGPLLSDVFQGPDDIAARFDLVHFICPYSSRDWLPLLSRRVPVVTSHHHVTSWDLVKHNVDGDAIIAGSSQWVEDLKHRGADISRVFRVPYGVDVDLFRPPSVAEREAARKKLGLNVPGPVVGFFAKKSSNDDDRKGTDIFISAISLLKKQLSGIGVLIVGPGWHDLVDRFRSEGINCAWIPFIEDSSDVPPLYHALDFYWVTARVEGGPVPLLEAMSSKVCCLTTPVGLANEVVRDGVNAFMLPMNDPDVFVEKTVELWNDDARRKAIGVAARATMKSEMSAGEMARLVAPAYERARENFGRRNPGHASGARKHSLSDAERRRAEMLEALAWSEHLVLYQDQRGAALKLIGKTWLKNPLSIQPPRVFLRRFLPGPITNTVVRAKRALRGASA